MRRIAGYMNDSGHALMLADKDGSFVVMPQGLFGDKALAAATVSRYLQRQLTGLAPEDPYKIASSDRLVGLLQDSIPGANSGFSIDIEELFYSIPHEDLFKAVRHCIERSGKVAFQNSSGVSVGRFLELLETYLTSTIQHFLEDAGTGGASLGPQTRRHEGHNKTFALLRLTHLFLLRR
ncbi:hypothetical protein HPB52_014357 [Rhipicephalus sanguineus]|uniref:Uncharacterized protein n=1 Tax=Rhipicephalus sanguineus TaxID=34632 RepID=A0A9D4YPZ8_RHISA|nr:hypothetical protein HPB52_014357 [Rhipicephalus sanguineus]